MFASKSPASTAARTLAISTDDSKGSNSFHSRRADSGEPHDPMYCSSISHKNIKRRGTDEDETAASSTRSTPKYRFSTIGVGAKALDGTAGLAVVALLTTPDMAVAVTSLDAVTAPAGASRLSTSGAGPAESSIYPRVGVQQNSDAKRANCKLGHRAVTGVKNARLFVPLDVIGQSEAQEFR